MACATSRAHRRDRRDDFRLDELLDRPYGKLSAGQKTRVSLAKALLNEPELLLLDEPTASLDPDTADWVRSKLEHYCREPRPTVVLASHNMAEVERLADRVIMLEKGRIIADETPAELIKRFGRSNLEEVFLAIARRGAEDGEGARTNVSAERRAPLASVARADDALRPPLGRIYGMVLRYWYVIRSSWPRTAELIYWPLVQMLMWGFLQSYLAQTTSFAAKAAGLFIGARAAVGHPGAQPARLCGGVSRRDLVAQPRPPDDEPAAARRARRRADDRQPHQADGGHGAGGAAGLPLLRLQRAEPRYSRSRPSLPTSSS